METETVQYAWVTGTLTPKDRKDAETYKITVVYSDGSKSVLLKKYEEFVDLQVTVYDLLRHKGGYSKKASRTLISCFPENASALSRILFKDSELKKMARIDNFIKELLALPSLVQKSEVVLKFFAALDGQKGTIIRSSEEEKLKNVNKVAEILSGRDPLRNIPEKSPLTKQKTRDSSKEIAGDWSVLSREARDQRYRKLNRHPSEEIPMITGKTRAISLDDGVLDKNAAFLRPGLKTRSLSAGAGLDNLFNEREQLKSGDELTKQYSGSENLSAQSHSSAMDSENSEEKESRLNLEEESPFQFGARNNRGRGRPSKKKHVVIRSFFAEESGEVSLEEGEEVDVLQKELSGWWYVKNDFCEGWAPSAFLAIGRSKSVSMQTIEKPQVSDEHWQIQENVDRSAKQKRGEVKRHTPQGKEKSPDKIVAKVAAQTKTSQTNQQVKLLSVEGIQKRKNPDKNYVYILKVVWSDGNINIIYRTCSDFFFFQENLRKEFGKEIPALKGRKFSKNCRFCFKDATCKRQKLMSQFSNELINAPDNISRSKVVLDFCRSRASDVYPHGESAKKDGKTTDNDADNMEISAPMMFLKYLVTADYKKKNKNDISLTAGDIIDVIERNDYGWWLVDHEGELGWAPASHLEPMDIGSEITSSNVFEPGKEEIYISLTSYQAKAEDELSFDADVMLKVVEKTLDGWWLVRYQGEEGWAPAMFLKRVDSDEPFTSKREKHTLDRISFNGDSQEKGESQGISRTPPTRRSMVQRTVRQIPNRNSMELNGTLGGEDGSGKTITSSGKISSPSVSEATTINTSALNRKVSTPSTDVSLSRSSPRLLSSEFSQGELDNPFQSRQFFFSSGGYNGPTASLSSLASSGVFTEEHSTIGIKKYASLPRLDITEGGLAMLQPSPGMRRSKSASSMEYYKNEMDSNLNGIYSTGRKSTSGGNSPSPSQRKISSNRGSSQASLRQRRRDSGFASLYNTSPRMSRLDIENDFHHENRKPEKRFAYPRFYKAMYTYNSQDEGEVGFREGDEVEVIQRSENGWWLVRTSEELGWGPSNFLQSLAY